MLTSRVEYGLVSENVCEHTTRYDSVLFGNRRTPTAMDWSLGSFGDVRLDRVGASILERMTLRKTVCLRRLGGDRGGELRFGRFFANEKVTAERIVDDWGRSTGPAAAGRHVLAIQDTSEVKFPTTAQRRRGLGLVKKGKAYGVLVHAMIAVDAPTGACLGLVGGEVWTRDGVVETEARERPLSERESMRWLDASEQAKTVLQSAKMVTVVGDRESDIYAQWASVPEDDFHVLTRAMNDRRLAGGRLLYETMAELPKVGQRTIELPARDPGREARTPKLELRFGTVEIVRPHSEWDRSLARTVTLRAIDVREIDATRGVEPLHWRLLTTHTIADAADAWCIVDWYRARWTIEQLFRILKSHGLQLEDSQVASAERLVKLAAAATKAACVDIQLTQERDGNARLPASTVFSTPEIETLAALSPSLEGNTERQRNPHLFPSLAAASWVIARLGGWNCYYLGVPPNRIYVDHGLTGANRARPGLDQALAAVRSGDILVVPRLDRLARSVPDARQIADDLAARGVTPALGKSRYNPADPMGRMFFNILATFAEFEADLIRLRTREGMAIARAKGRLRGKQPKLSDKQQRELRRMHGTGKYSISDLAELFSISRPTVYRTLARGPAS